MLRLTDINKSFNSTQVLKNFSYIFPVVGVVALTGVSGVGKSTLLNIIAGLIKPDSGSVENTYKKTAYGFQEHRLFDWLSAKENVELVIEDKTAKERLSSELISAVGLTDAEEKFPSELSGGMKQRVSIARTFAYGADLIILDEPFKELDEDSKFKIYELINNYRNSSLIILVTHDKNDVDALADETIELK